LRSLGRYSIEFRRMRGDLFESYRILKGLDRVDGERMFPLVGETTIRGHTLRVKGLSFKTEMRRNLFSQRVVNLWNSLPQRAVEAESLSIIKTEVDSLLINKGITVYGEKAGQWGYQP